MHQTFLNEIEILYKLDLATLLKNMTLIFQSITFTYQDCALKEAPSVEPLLGIKYIQDLKWNSDIQYIAKDPGQGISSIYRSRMYQTPSAMLYLYKRKIKLKLD